MHKLTLPIFLLFATISQAFDPKPAADYTVTVHVSATRLAVASFKIWTSSSTVRNMNWPRSSAWDNCWCWATTKRSWSKMNTEPPTTPTRSTNSSSPTAKPESSTW
jgi:hypothetical protein